MTEITSRDNLNVARRKKIVVGRWLIAADHKQKCECADFVRNSGKELCEHTILTLLKICPPPENSKVKGHNFLCAAAV